MKRVPDKKWSDKNHQLTKPSRPTYPQLTPGLGGESEPGRPKAHSDPGYATSFPLLIPTPKTRVEGSLSPAEPSFAKVLTVQSV